MPIFSFCMNCGGAKSPPYTQHYCDTCESARMEARERAIAAGQNPSAASRAALDILSFDTKGTRPNPRVPYTKHDATREYLDSFLPPPPPAGA